MGRPFHVYVKGSKPRGKDKWHTLEARNLTDAAQLAAIKYPGYEYVIPDMSSPSSKATVHYNTERKRK